MVLGFDSLSLNREWLYVSGVRGGGRECANCSCGVFHTLPRLSPIFRIRVNH